MIPIIVIVVDYYTMIGGEKKKNNHQLKSKLPKNTLNASYSVSIQRDLQMESHL